MTAALTMPPKPESSRSTVTVELANKAALDTQILHHLVLHPVRLGLLAASHVMLRSNAKQLLWFGRVFDQFLTPLAPAGGTRSRLVALDKCRAEWLWDADVADPDVHRDSAILYFHGGAFFFGGLNSHRRLVARLAKASGMPALQVDYRQLPDAQFTDSVDDAVTAYRHLLDQGFAAERIIVAGDSAGGALAFHLALAARAAGLPMPGAISTIAPWGNFDWTVRNAHPNAHRDSYLPALGAQAVAQIGFGVNGVLDPALSAVNHDFTGLPPVLIQVGSHECLLPDAEQLAQRCAEAEVDCLLQIWDRAAHVHQVGADLLSDGRAAIAAMAAFHRRTIAATAESLTPVC